MKQAMVEHKQNVSRIHAFLKKRSDKRMIMRLMSNRLVVQTCKNMHGQLDQFIRCYGLKTGVIHEWNGHWAEDFKSQELFLKESIEQLSNSPDLLKCELKDSRAQAETLILMMFEYDKRSSKYTKEETDLIRRVFESARSLSSLMVSEVPPWFVPPHEIEFGSQSIGSGAYGSVHRGTWNGAVHAIKVVTVSDSKCHESFLHEVDIWYSLRHPNIVLLFRACHVGNPFFLCEFASEGTLIDYLSRHEFDRVKTWEKIYEAALGLWYLHEKHKVVHGGLKCNNILVGSDDKVKPTDFGLSFITSSEASNDFSGDEVGAICWKAPEVIAKQTRGTFESDVYSFGMCILEALKKGVAPWGIKPGVVTKTSDLTESKTIFERPDKISESQWDS